MNSDQTTEAERLYLEGMEYYRSAEWGLAIQTLRRLKAISGAHPEIDGLIANAKLKLELERTESIPETLLPPRRSSKLWIAVLIVVLLLGGGLAAGIFIFRNPEFQPNLAAALALPTEKSPTAAVPSPLPATSAPTALATIAPTEPTPSDLLPGAGMIEVRMTEGYTLTHTIETIEIILDASGSMSGPIEGKPKIEIAHDALATMLNQLPNTTKVALRAYGHRRSEDCSDVELVSPPKPIDRGVLLDQIKRIKPVHRSRSPIGLTLQQVAADMLGLEGDKAVVLVSDGDETCDSDPVKIAAQLRSNDPQLYISVIGFDVGPVEWRERLSETARVGGGRYFDAVNTTQLVAALQEAVKLTYRVYGDGGVLVYQGPIGSTTALPNGQYRVEISGTPPVVINPVEITGKQPTIIEIYEEDGVVKATIIE